MNSPVPNRLLTCKKCGNPIEQPYNKQGGGMTKKFCSARCRALDWAHRNKKKRKASVLKYDSKPENKLKKKLRQRGAWHRLTEEYKLISHARTRAREKGLEVSLCVSDIKIPKICPLLGIPIVCGTGKCSGNSPSIDRKDSTRGYTPDNIWVISHKANTAKSDLTLHQLKELTENLEAVLVEQKIHENRKD
jgi:endogenous inhibitor of DNA gyrase (YacG/DUF329 family)